MQVEQAEQLWTACSGVLREQVSEAVWMTTFSSVVAVRLDGNQLLIAVPNTLVKERIENRYLPILDGVLTDIGKSGMRLVIEVRTEDAPRPVDSTADLDRDIPSSFHNADVDLLTSWVDLGNSASRSPPDTPSTPSSPVPRTGSPTLRP